MANYQSTRIEFKIHLRAGKRTVTDETSSFIMFIISFIIILQVGFKFTSIFHLYDLRKVSICAAIAFFFFFFVLNIKTSLGTGSLSGNSRTDRQIYLMRKRLLGRRNRAHLKKFDLEIPTGKPATAIMSAAMIPVRCVNTSSNVTSCSRCLVS